MQPFDQVKFKPTTVNLKELKQFDSEDQFMFLAIELLKDIAKLSLYISNIVEFDNKGNQIKWNKIRAAYGGLLIRISKLQISFIKTLCEHDMYIATIIMRCLSDSLITLLFLLVSDSETVEEYIKHSLNTEKELLDKIQQNAKGRGQDTPIELRMRRSIEKSFKASEVDINTFRVIGKKEFKAWKPSPYDRANSIKMSEEYFVLVSLPSHSIHGNWQDLLNNHLEYYPDGFLPNLEKSRPRPQPVVAMGILSIKVNTKYLEKFVPNSNDKNTILTCLKDLKESLIALDNQHELYLQSR
ncbi:MAG: hypothetical protein JNK26_04005 [Candidatus Doudnabacteria bacterium]|nr:hypothetical protein [Candidatus Doudnabacteria bacterium]